MNCVSLALAFMRGEDGVLSCRKSEPVPTILELPVYAIYSTYKKLFVVNFELYFACEAY
jgi:hypothetical protein